MIFVVRVATLHEWRHFLLRAAELVLGELEHPVPGPDRVSHGGLGTGH